MAVMVGFVYGIVLATVLLSVRARRGRQWERQMHAVSLSDAYARGVREGLAKVGPRKRPARGIVEQLIKDDYVPAIMSMITNPEWCIGKTSPLSEPQAKHVRGVLDEFAEALGRLVDEFMHGPQTSDGPFIAIETDDDGDVIVKLAGRPGAHLVAHAKTLAFALERLSRLIALDDAETASTVNAEPGHPPGSGFGV